MNLIEFTPKGMYCRQGDFYIDPWKPVERALITHAHGDHARHGHQKYLSHHDSIPIMKVRLGFNIYEGVNYGEIRTINGVKISFHPAGHIIGSSQIRLEYRGHVWVASGDYKTEYDGISPEFETVKCDTFITESTFGLPVYNWKPQQEIFNDINLWWRQNQENGITSVIHAYSLGKAQRILHNIDRSIGPVYVHGSIFNLNKAIIASGISLKNGLKIDADMKKDIFRNSLVLAPPGATINAWLKKFDHFAIGVASGWMASAGGRTGESSDKGFALSDHADWPGLNAAIKATGAERVIVTHGFTAAFSRWLNENGYDSRTVETQFTGDSPAMAPEEEALIAE